MPDTNITRIRRYGIVNIFLLKEDDGLTVIDTGLPRSARSVISAAGLLNLPIKRILLTHAHDDHVGSLDELAKAVPDAEVLVSARDARLIAGDLTLDEGEAPGKLRGGLHGTGTEPSRTIADGEMVGSLRAIATPGHTPGHMAFLDTRDGTLFCGDVFSTLGGLATTARVNPLFPLPALATWNAQLDLASARLLQELEPARLAPGHGRVIEQPAEDIELVIAKAAKKVEA